MKMLIIIALALALGVAAIWAADFEPGFVLLQYGQWSLETSLVVFTAIYILLVVAGYLALRSLVLLKQTPKRINAWKTTQRQKRANRALTRGLITLEEGRWTEAERILVRHATHSETPLLHYLAAARAAQKQQAPERRDNYLRLAHETTEGADIAVGVVQAELQLSAGQKEQALATLQHLREVAPKHPYVLQLLQSLYQDMDQWQEMQSVLPDLRKRHVLERNEVAALDQEAAVGQLQMALAKQDWQKMAEVWEKSSSKARQTEAMLVPYVNGLIQQDQEEQAIAQIEQFMRNNWSDKLVYIYGVLTQGDLLARLATAEKWLKANPDNACLLLTVGRLAKANQLWTKAEEYLQQSIRLDAKGETYQVLAEVQLALDKNEAAADTYKQGLTLMLSSDATI
ncbi:MAG: heme biosynthesis HemY N-terminal domain-containing protein [Pseudomonadota bacterium]|uniref:Heme biosynthesis protein HemY n=1 Tax=Methylophaga thalassica TaxID=40223 RepID=A0ABQ5TWU2_9GAMM|nr:heme biosynthesis HemY N-terminal domain-containing protein [Methylophaga thalassica]MEC9412731.1 heme biosynthesis HemY N-terminal domain-containing protein [Pseudomonadota bacterium]GLQ00440.1 heme biosynthesis protein HemY [Methylophaga thalassica]